ncbi:MAG: cyclic nucleotide-binding domain-containing protein [Chloroflexi bacterium]|nr:cyclic nucleotide-binding domain-containing protein [Chloroflexota bacterium]
MTAAPLDPLDLVTGWSSRDPADELSRTPLFSELSREHLLALSQRVTHRVAPAGKELFQEGSHGEEIFIILRGKVKIVKQDASGQQRTVATLEDGSHFGEMALVDPGPRSAGAVAATDLEYLALRRPDFLNVIESFPSVALQLLRTYNHRLAQTTAQLVEATRQVDITDQPAASPIARAVTRLPFPIAALVRKLAVEEQPDRRIARLLDVHEVLVKYTCMALLADYLRGRNRSPEADALVSAALRKPTLGQLDSMARRVVKTFEGVRRDLLFMPELLDFYYDEHGHASPTSRALLALTSFRNRLKHGAEGARDDESFVADWERYGPVVEQVLAGLGFLGDYPLISITWMTYESGRFQYGYECAMGAYAVFEKGSFPGNAPLEHKQLYLLDTKRLACLPLEPFLTRARCPACGANEIWVLFNFQRDRQEYLSYDCGHSLVAVRPRASINRLMKRGGLAGAGAEDEGGTDD